MRSMKKGEKRIEFLQTVLLVIVAAVFVLPIYIAIANTFKDSGIILDQPLSLPIPPILDNIISVWNDPNSDLVKMYLNSAVLMVAGTVLTILLSSLAAYYLARNKTKFSGTMRIYFLIGIMVPYVIVYLPLCILLRHLNIPFGLPVLILVFASGNISFSTFMYTNYINSLPSELEEAAMLDGASKMQIFWKILFPLLRPCTATVAIFVGLGIWNDFQTPLLLGQIKTITVGIYTAVGPHSANWGIVFAYVFFAAAPVIIAYLCMQKNFVKGLTMGAMKG